MRRRRLAKDKAYESLGVVPILKTLALRHVNMLRGIQKLAKIESSITSGNLDEDENTLIMDTTAASDSVFANADDSVSKLKDLRNDLDLFMRGL